jgi:hypothetical protein
MILLKTANGKIKADQISCWRNRMSGKELLQESHHRTAGDLCFVITSPASASLLKPAIVDEKM